MCRLWHLKTACYLHFDPLVFMFNSLPLLPSPMPACLQTSMQPVTGPRLLAYMPVAAKKITWSQHVDIGRKTHHNITKISPAMGVIWRS